jgi:hypothetical protein
VTAAAHGIGRATALALPPSSVLATDIAEDKLAADALLLHRTRNRKFESISLQRRVSELSVPQTRRRGSEEMPAEHRPSAALYLLVSHQQFSAKAGAWQTSTR